MRTLEARFHPKRASDYLVVGYLTWSSSRETERPRIELRAGSPWTHGNSLSKLEYLVSITHPGSFERLQTLHSQFWSFAEVVPVREQHA